MATVYKLIRQIVRTEFATGRVDPWVGSGRITTI